MTVKTENKQLFSYGIVFTVYSDTQFNDERVTQTVFSNNGKIFNIII